MSVIVLATVFKGGSASVANPSTGAVRVDPNADKMKRACASSRKITDEKLLQSEKLFGGITPDESSAVVEYMLQQSSLRLKRSNMSKLDDNYIFSIEDVLPSKPDVLKWLDGRTQLVPERKARVVLFMGETRSIREFLVSPVPNPQRHEELLPNKLSWQARPVCNTVEHPLMSKYIVEQLEAIADVFLPSFAKDCSKVADCVYMNVAPRVAIDSTDRHVIAWFFISPFKMIDYYLYALPFYIVIRTPSNSVNFEIAKVYYNGRTFNSLADLKDEYHKNTNIRYKHPNLDAQSLGFGSPQRVLLGNTIDQKRRPPVQYHPDGPRMAVSGSAVEWLGWSFNIHPRTVTGIQLFNVQYKKERIAYELSMQDILVLYSGGAPDDYFKSYFDNGWSIGAASTPLVRGVDCPQDAVYMNSNTYIVGKDQGVSINDSICIFEHRNSIPLHRHYSSSFLDGSYRYAFSMPDSVLIVRQILTLWNYDYIFDYEFHQNGVIELKVSSTGYVAVTTNLDGSTNSHGYVINDGWKATANLHQHIFNFRLDLDIDGINNNFKTIDISKTTPTKHDFSGAKTWSQIIMQESVIDNEQDAAIRYDFSRPKLYVMYDNKTSKQRGYRIQSNNFHNPVLSDSSPLLAGGASWTKYQLAVTKFNESETTTASAFVQGDPFNPAINFDDFIENNDKLTNEDLVAWVTVGLHHIPTYEDLPVTSTPGKTLSVVLAPFNYFERDPAIHSRDAAVFWHEVIQKPDGILYQNDTCLVPNVKPSVYP